MVSRALPLFLAQHCSERSNDKGHLPEGRHKAQQIPSCMAKAWPDPDLLLELMKPLSLMQRIWQRRAEGCRSRGRGLGCWLMTGSSQSSPGWDQWLLTDDSSPAPSSLSARGVHQSHTGELKCITPPRQESLCRLQLQRFQLRIIRQPAQSPDQGCPGVVTANPSSCRGDPAVP